MLFYKKFENFKNYKLCVLSFLLHPNHQMIMMIHIHQMMIIIIIKAEYYTTSPFPESDMSTERLLLTLESYPSFEYLAATAYSRSPPSFYSRSCQSISSADLTLLKS